MPVVLLTALLFLLVGVFPAPAADNLPPVAQIVSPTNHTEFRWGDGVGRFLVAVHVADPESSIASVQVEMNDQIIVTNRLGDYEVDFDFVQPESGQIKLTVIDDQGLIATDTVSFTSVQVGFSFVTLQIFPQNDHLLITSSNTGLGFLQESNDWLQWTDVALLDTNRFVIPLTANRRFYRVHFQSNPSAPAAQTSHTLSNVRHGPSSSRRYTGDNPWRNARCSRSETFFFPQTGRKVEPRKSPSW